MTQEKFDALMRNPEFQQAVTKLTKILREEMGDFTSITIGSEGGNAQTRHVISELVGGKHDGLIFDSTSNDASERALARTLEGSPEFEVIERVATDTGAWVQLRSRRS